MNTFFLPRAGRVTLGLAFAAFISATLSVQAASPLRVRQVSARSLTNGFAAEPAGETLRPAERAFLSKAVESSRQQMRLAEVGVSQAENSDVRSHALQMVTDFRALNDALEALIRRKGGIAGAPVGGTSESYQKLAEKGGGTFDREFVRIVAQLSNETLTLFEQVASDSKVSDVRDLAAAQLPILRAHRTAITELKKIFE